jgi:hypothetical protein
MLLGDDVRVMMRVTEYLYCSVTCLDTALWSLPLVLALELISVGSKCRYYQNEQSSFSLQRRRKHLLKRVHKLRHVHSAGTWSRTYQVYIEILIITCCSP